MHVCVQKPAASGTASHTAHPFVLSTDHRYRLVLVIYRAVSVDTLAAKSLLCAERMKERERPLLLAVSSCA
jgi:hypothetical protein